MKLALLGITSFLFVFFSALSHANERPILGKYNYPGLVLAEEYTVESCEIFRGGYLLRTVRNMESTESSETFEVPVDVSLIMDLIMQARTEVLHVKENYLCDTPSTSITAFGSRELNPEGRLTLFETGGCGSAQERRIGPATEELMKILGAFCPTTFEATNIDEVQ